MSKQRLLFITTGGTIASVRTQQGLKPVLTSEELLAHLPELKELVSLMRRSSNNLNQLTRRVHETGRIYDADLEDISQRQEALWDGVHQVLTQLAKLS